MDGRYCGCGTALGKEEIQCMIKKCVFMPDIGLLTEFERSMNPEASPRRP